MCVYEKETHNERGRAMNEMTARIIEGIHNGRFGVEVEGNNITRQKAARVAAKYFGTGRYENTAARNGYSTYSAWDQQGREWRFAKDVSIEGPDNMKTELITPLLDYSELEFFLELLRRLRKAGMRSTPEAHCGIHIHAYEEGHTPQSLTNLAFIMAAREEQIGRAIKLDEYRKERYCRTVSPDFINRLKEHKPQTMEELERCWYNGRSERYIKYHQSRYACLNYHSLFQGKGLEFRQFQFSNPNEERKGGIDCHQMKAYIQLCLGMSELAKQVKYASPNKPQTENDAFSFRTWLLRLGFIGDEFKTARKVLLSELEGNSAHRNAA